MNFFGEVDHVHSHAWRMKYSLYVKDYNLIWMF